MSMDAPGFREAGYGPFPIQISLAVDALIGLVCIGAVWSGRMVTRSLLADLRVRNSNHAVGG